MADENGVVHLSKEAIGAKLVNEGEPYALEYRPTPPVSYWYSNEAVHPWRVLWDVPQMLPHPVVQQSLQYFKSGISDAEFDVKASSKQVAEFALEQVEKLWANLSQVQQGYEWGWRALEPVYKEEKHRIHLDSFLGFEYRDAVPLTRKGRYVGIRIKSECGSHTSGVTKTKERDLWGPRRTPAARGKEPDIPAKGYWYAHNSHYNRWFGRTQLYAGWLPWKRLTDPAGGAEIVTDMAVYRFGVAGPVLKHPLTDNMNPGDSAGTQDPDSARSRAREFVEQAKAGASVALPSTYYENGKPKWELIWPEHVIQVDPLLNYGGSLEDKIAAGIGTPKELMEASEVGSGYSGRAIPLEGFLMGQQRLAEGIARTFCEQILEPLVRFNFGLNAWCRVKVKSLLATKAKNAQPPQQLAGMGIQGAMPGMPPGMPPPSAGAPPPPPGGPPGGGLPGVPPGGQDPLAMLLGGALPGGEGGPEGQAKKLSTLRQAAGGEWLGRAESGREGGWWWHTGTLEVCRTRAPRAAQEVRLSLARAAEQQNLQRLTTIDIGQWRREVGPRNAIRWRNTATGGIRYTEPGSGQRYGAHPSYAGAAQYITGTDWPNADTVKQVAKAILEMPVDDIRALQERAREAPGPGLASTGDNPFVALLRRLLAVDTSQEDEGGYLPEKAREYVKGIVQEAEGMNPARLSTGAYSYSSTQFNLPDDVAEKILAFGKEIADEDLADSGRENEIHTTLKFGLHCQRPDEVRELLDGEGPIKVKLGKVSIFPAAEALAQRGGEQYDVVKVEVKGKDIHRLNRLLSDNLEHTDTHPRYVPHCTVALVKPGKGQKYAELDGDRFAGLEVPLDAVIFSNKSGKRTTIKLAGNDGAANLATTTAANPWTDAGQTGSGHQRWLNQVTKEMRYQPHQPGAHETGGNEEPLAAVTTNPPEPAHNSRQAAREAVGRKVDSWLEQARGVPPGKRDHYQHTIHGILDGLSAGALGRLYSNVKAIHFLPSLEAMAPHYRRLSKQGLRPDEVIGGMWDCQNGHLYLDGGPETGDDYTLPTRGIYAHEIGHAIDGPRHELSEDWRWQRVWQAEINQHDDRGEPALTRQARKSATEGLAEYHRLVDENPHAAQHEFPLCWHFWVEQGLAPEGQPEDEERERVAPEARFLSSLRRLGITDPAQWSSAGTSKSGMSKWINNQTRAIRYQPHAPGSTHQTQAWAGVTPQARQAAATTAQQAYRDLDNEQHVFNRYRGDLKERDFGNGTKIRSIIEPNMSAQDHSAMAKLHGQAAEILQHAGQTERSQAHTLASHYHAGLSQHFGKQGAGGGAGGSATPTGEHGGGHITGGTRPQAGQQNPPAPTAPATPPVAEHASPSLQGAWAPTPALPGTAAHAPAPSAAAQQGPTLTPAAEYPEQIKGFMPVAHQAAIEGYRSLAEKARAGGNETLAGDYDQRGQMHKEALAGAGGAAPAAGVGGEQKYQEGMTPPPVQGPPRATPNPSAVPPVTDEAAFQRYLQDFDREFKGQQTGEQAQPPTPAPAAMPPVAQYVGETQGPPQAQALPPGTVMAELAPGQEEATKPAAPAAPVASATPTTANASSSTPTPPVTPPPLDKPEGWGDYQTLPVGPGMPAAHPEPTPQEPLQEELSDWTPQEHKDAIDEFHKLAVRARQDGKEKLAAHNDEIVQRHQAMLQRKQGGRGTPPAEAAPATAPSPAAPAGTPEQQAKTTLTPMPGAATPPTAPAKPAAPAQTPTGQRPAQLDPGEGKKFEERVERGEVAPTAPATPTSVSEPGESDWYSEYKALQTAREQGHLLGPSAQQRLDELQGLVDNALGKQKAAPPTPSPAPAQPAPAEPKVATPAIPATGGEGARPESPPANATTASIAKPPQRPTPAPAGQKQTAAVAKQQRKKKEAAKPDKKPAPGKQAKAQTPPPLPEIQKDWSAADHTRQAGEFRKLAAAARQRGDSQGAATMEQTASNHDDYARQKQAAPAPPKPATPAGQRVANLRARIQRQQAASELKHPPKPAAPQPAKDDLVTQYPQYANWTPAQHEAEARKYRRYEQDFKDDGDEAQAAANARWAQRHEEAARAKAAPPSVAKPPAPPAPAAKQPATPAEYAADWWDNYISKRQKLPGADKGMANRMQALVNMGQIKSKADLEREIADDSEFRKKGKQAQAAPATAAASDTGKQQGAKLKALVAKSLEPANVHKLGRELQDAMMEISPLGKDDLKTIAEEMGLTPEKTKPKLLKQIERKLEEADRVSDSSQV